jgi:hypothetical protein
VFHSFIVASLAILRILTIVVEGILLGDSVRPSIWDSAMPSVCVWLHPCPISNSADVNIRATCRFEPRTVWVSAVVSHRLAPALSHFRRSADLTLSSTVYQFGHDFYGGTPGTHYDPRFDAELRQLEVFLKVWGIWAASTRTCSSNISTHRQTKIHARPQSPMKLRTQKTVLADKLSLY